MRTVLLGGALVFGAFTAIAVYARLPAGEEPGGPWERGVATVVHGAAVRVQGGEPPRACQVNVRYRYHARGVEYIGHKVWPGSQDVDCKAARAAARKLRPGATVQVLHRWRPLGSKLAHKAPSHRGRPVEAIFFGLLTAICLVLAWRVPADAVYVDTDNPGF